MRRRDVAIVLAVVLGVAFALFVPVVPSGAVITPPPCGTPPVTCHATEVHLISPTHALFGIGAFFWELSGNGTLGFEWHYGFDV